MDLWGEATKLGGCDEPGAEAVFRALGGDPRLPVQGFMAIPPPEDARAFRALAELREAWQQKLGRPLRLSMGMSADLEQAVAAGTDQIRIGTAFFGEPLIPSCQDMPVLAYSGLHTLVCMPRPPASAFRRSVRWASGRT